MKKIYIRLKLIFLFVGCIHPAGELAAQPDIGATAIASPAIPFCAGVNNVDILLSNFGTDTVFTAVVQWTVNGISQPQYLFVDTLAPAEVQQVSIGTFNFGRKTTYTIFAASSDPNGLPDADPSNDSITRGNLICRMTGNFSAGIISDYPAINDAVNDLVSRGVCGPVVININPGIFNEQISIPEIAGSSAVNTIKFQSSTADSTSVIITHPSSASPTDNYTLKMDGSDFITFSQLTLQRSGSSPYAHVTVLTRKATGNTFTNLRFEGAIGVTDDSLASLVYSDTSSSDIDSLNTFMNSVFADGAAGINMAGPDKTHPETGNSILGNVFINQYAAGMSLADQSFLLVSGNTISTTSTFSGYRAIGCIECLAKFTISKNRIEGVPGTGIYLSGCLGDSSAVNILSNNFIHAIDSACIVLSGNNFLDVVNNSAHNSSSDPAHTGLLARGKPQVNRIINNVLMNSGGGYAYVITDTANAGISTSDFNDLFTAGFNTGRFNGSDMITLADWITAAASDSNSVSADPEFTSASDLHAASYLVDNAGIPLASVSDDIDGELRNASMPDIGADEFTALVHDLAVTTFLSPADGSCEDPSTVIRIVVSNTGNYPEAGFTIHADISGAITATLTEPYPGSLAAGASDTLSFTQTINTTGGGSYTFVITVSSLFDVHPENDTLITVCTVFPLPQIFLGNDTTVVFPQTVLLTAPPGFTAYAWNTGDTVQSIIAGSSGLYILSVTDSNGCTGVDSIFVNVLTAVNGMLSENELKIFPNPTSENIKVEWKLSNANYATIYLRDVSGRLLSQADLSKEQGSLIGVIDLSKYSKGVYFLQLVSGDKILAKRLVVN